MIKSGHGGRGCESYLRRPDRKRVPNGGDGGDGGDVIIKTHEHATSLLPLKSKRLFEAEAGGAGAGNNCYGRNGKPLILRVPCGTTVYDQGRRLLLRDLIHPNEEVVVAGGGRGGYGNHSGRPATKGDDGAIIEVVLSLAVIADIFLIGLPNSGKTTLLKYLTGAGLQTTDYPFATKSPCLGTYQTMNEKYRFCELPSVYSRSHEGKGLGIHFLKHLKRAKLIFLMLDPENPFARGVQKGYDTILRAIEKYNPAYRDIPRVVVINKQDLLKSRKEKSRRYSEIKDPVFLISARHGIGIKRLMKQVSLILGVGQ